MASSNLLPADLLDTLLCFTAPFAETAAQFRDRISTDGDGTFPRICELLNTLELLAESKQPISHLRELRGGTTNDENGPEALLSFMLNGEFVLYEHYREFEVTLNPSLAHWVGVCRAFDKYDQEHGDDGEWGIREILLKMRASFVKGILGNQGKTVCSSLVPSERKLTL